jgi:murein DD-endopeptidase MepM/ murein hydrolase activator NlpD
MRVSAVAFFMILTTVFLSGCGKSEMADVTDRGNNFYGRFGTTTLSGAMGSLARAAGTYSETTVAASDTATLSVASSDLPPPSLGAAPAAPFGSASVAATNWQWPVNGQVTKYFGKQADGTGSEGIVIAAAEGTPIRAAQAGTVAFVGNDSKTYGNIVILRHMSGSMTAYSHARDVKVTQGQQVRSGEVIAHVGQSGKASQPQLHFAVRDGGASIDPLRKLPQHMAMN